MFSKQDFMFLLKEMKSHGYNRINKDTIYDFYINYAGKCDLCINKGLCSICRSLQGEGDINSEYLFIGAITNKNEYNSGKIFPESYIEGKNLEKYLECLGLNRRDIFLVNSIQGYFDDDRAREMLCLFWIRLIIKIMKPKYVFLLGKETASRILPARKIDLHVIYYIESSKYCVVEHPSLATLRSKSFESSCKFLMDNKERLGGRIYD